MMKSDDHLQTWEVMVAPTTISYRELGELKDQKVGVMVKLQGWPHRPIMPGIGLSIEMRCCL